MEYLYGRDDLFFLRKQTDYAAIGHNEGVALIAGTDACRHSSLKITPIRPRLAPSYKEDGSARVYIDNTRPGKMSGTAALSLPLFSSTGAGVEADCGLIWEAAFGQKSISNGVSVTYSRLPTGMVPVELWGFNLAGLRGAVAYGSILNRLTLTAGEERTALSTDWICRYALTQDRFPNASTAEKAGLTAWPNVPTPTYTGDEILGFTGSFLADGQAFNLRNFTITMNWNRQYDTNHFANDGSEYLSINPFERKPEILLDFSVWSTDDANLTTLLGKIANRTPIPAVIAIGATAGSTYTFTLHDLIIPEGSGGEGWTHDDPEDRKAITVTGLRAQATNTSTYDEISLVHT